MRDALFLTRPSRLQSLNSQEIEPFMQPCGAAVDVLHDDTDGLCDCRAVWTAYYGDVGTNGRNSPVAHALHKPITLFFCDQIATAEHYFIGTVVTIGCERNPAIQSYRHDESDAAQEL
jgi:hypothetical protein